MVYRLLGSSLPSPDALLSSAEGSVLSVQVWTRHPAAMEEARPGQLPEGRRTRAEALKQGSAGTAQQPVTAQELQPKVLLLGACLASNTGRIQIPATRIPYREKMAAMQ